MTDHAPSEGSMQAAILDIVRKLGFLLAVVGGVIFLVDILPLPTESVLVSHKIALTFFIVGGAISVTADILQNWPGGSRR